MEKKKLEIEEDDVIIGTISRVLDHGYVVDLGNDETGTLRGSASVIKYYKTGDKVKVRVLKIEYGACRFISLEEVEHT